VLPGPGADQQVTHGIGVAGDVRQDVGSAPPGQQRGRAQIRLGQDPGGIEQALRGLIELVVQLAKRGIHPPTVKRPHRR
jgi:hypothetical protein